MRFKIFLISLCCCWFTSSAQERIPVNLNSTQFNLNILDPSVTFEKSINDNQSFTAAAGITFLFDDQAEEGNYSLNPFIRTSYRNYYPRKRVKKELNPNSGNYIGAVVGYYLNAITDDVEVGSTKQSNSFYVGPVWGIQRNYKSGIHLNLSIGPGLGIGEDSELYYAPTGEIEFGFVIK